MMSDGSGHEVLETLATQRPDVKCVVVISASSPSNIEQVEIANVQAKLRKPFDIHELVAAVENCVA
jgi:DNA-binding NarL/FixJ family response regulator